MPCVGTAGLRKSELCPWEEIVEWISKYKYGNINDLDYRKEIIDTFVNSVFVYDEKSGPYLQL